MVDWRNVPTESEADVLATLEPLMDRSLTDGVAGSLSMVQRHVSTYTGIDAVMPSTRGFETPASDPLVTCAVSALQAQLERDVEIGVWGFATDGGHLNHYGITTIGFSPGEERFAHTIHDQISLSKMREALPGNVALALAIPAIEQVHEPVD